MKVEEWRFGNDAIGMFDIVKASASLRKLRLLACALCEVYKQHIPKEDWSVVELTSRVADGLASECEMEAAIVGTCHTEVADDFFWVYLRMALYAHALGGRKSGEPMEHKKLSTLALERFTFSIHVSSPPNLCERLRELFGLLSFCPVTVDPVWRTSTVLLLASGIYNDRAFDRMPILADALQDAGCDNDDILNHLRDATATHVRGCWALDLILGKE